MPFSIMVTLGIVVVGDAPKKDLTLFLKKLRITRLK